MTDELKQSDLEIATAVKERIHAADVWSEATGYPAHAYFDCMTDLRRMVRLYDSAIHTPSPRVDLLERVAEIAAKVQSGAKEAYRPHGAIICPIAHAPLADALNEQEKALAAINAVPSEEK